jgi:hypothetical protein
VRPAARQDVIDYLAAQGIFQDAREIAAVSALIAGGQLLAGADPTEVGIAALAGAGVSAATKPIAAAAGRGVGRYLDNHPIQVPPRAESAHRVLMASMTGSQDDLARRKVAGTLSEPEARLAKEIYKVNYKDGDRTRGKLEGDYGMIARRYGDNVAQAVIQMAVPGLIPDVDVEPAG